MTNENKSSNNVDLLPIEIAKKTLYRQLEILSIRTKNVTNDDLIKISHAMASIFTAIIKAPFGKTG